jgi:hypothetical protein
MPRRRRRRAKTPRPRRATPGGCGEAAATVDAGADDTDRRHDEELEDDDYVAPYVAPKPENYDARVKELDARYDAAAAKFQKGDDGYDLRRC